MEPNKVMMNSFSQKLIEDLKLYWLKRQKAEISTEDSVRYLFTLAELYLSLYKIEQDKK